VAKIWPVYGSLQAGSWGESPWPECLVLFELDPALGMNDCPTIIGEAPTTDTFPSHVVIQLEAAEAQRHGIAPGYFLSPLDGIAAKARLDKARGLRDVMP
jgi:hypothetical protein